MTIIYIALGILAAMIIAACTCLIALGDTPPEELWSTLTLIIGGLVGAITVQKQGGSPPAPPPH